MSASLVGSEMCIRDREGSEGLRLRASSDLRNAPDLIRALFAAGATPGEAVSYTHLTLPTICSV
eukprot:8253245-Alexandrium_andersonii.AAC.1